MRLQTFILTLVVGLSFNYGSTIASERSAIKTTGVVVYDSGKPGDFFATSHTEVFFVGYDLSVADTQGNHTYIPINRIGTPVNFKNDILRILYEFETTHSNDLRVTNWKIEKDQETHFTQAFVFGIWIDHEPKKVIEK
ncbi:MAG: hypothetical protein HY226_06820 [Candidatus Vogelbacteria bacterium]|nr:hypothetical protein [Candidatus Vogelbacteria bacterium]